MDLKQAAVDFINIECAELRWNEQITEEEKASGAFMGTSLRPNQIPYDMQADIDRLCLQNAILRFLESGIARDAFDVYFCYMDMFVGEYENTRPMVELLSEFESNGSSLLMKHRDHYSHSVYVFILGLAIFETNREYRSIYKEYYGLENDKKAAHHYLQHWGLTALFHDIGYPLELPFEQVTSYFEVNNKNRDEVPYMAYHEMMGYLKGCDEILAGRISEKLGKTYHVSYDYILSVINRKPVHPEEFSYFMDHAVFSAAILYKNLYQNMDRELAEADIDALSAIILHNSMYKFCVAHYKDDGNIPLRPELMPLAYMLMLCDELQCWDRIAYGRNSRSEIQPMDCRFDLSDGKLMAEYIYDVSQEYKAVNLKEKAPGRKDFDFDIASIVNMEIVGLESSLVWEERKTSKKRTYLSNSNFMHLYNFAIALNGRWMSDEEWKQAEEEGKEREFLISREEEFKRSFEKLSLEYKLSNINQAKAFDGYLNMIGAFYSDRPVDYPELKGFTVEECLKIGPMEHKRWLKEHLEMGWKHGKFRGDERELKRMHPDMIDDVFLVDGKVVTEAALLHYRMLNKETQDKDVEPMNAMLSLLEIFDGVRVYRLR